MSENCGGKLDLLTCWQEKTTIELELWSSIKVINFWYKAFQNVIVWIICTELYSIHLLATLVCPLAKDPRSKNLKNYLVESKDVKIRSNYGWIIGSPRSEITSLRIFPEIPDHISFTEFHFGTEYYTTRIGANGLIRYRIFSHRASWEPHESLKYGPL